MSNQWTNLRSMQTTSEPVSDKWTKIYGPNYSDEDHIDIFESGYWSVIITYDFEKMWDRFKQATLQGHLGYKTSYISLHGSKDIRIICVYTLNKKDVEDILRVRKGMRIIGIGWAIPYKDFSGDRMYFSTGEGLNDKQA